MNCLRVVLIVSLVFTCTTAMAKRTAPKEVVPLRVGDVEYRVPHFSHTGCIEAWDVKHGRMLWRKQIYVIRYDAVPEKDVQDIFITSIEMKEKILLIKNERDSEYELNLESLEVKVVKGVPVHEK
jgi:hypothetical protein